MSLDISAISTGWAVVSNKNNDYIFGTIKTKTGLDTSERLNVFRIKLLRLMKKYKPAVVILEDTFVGRNPKVNKLLSKFGGVAEQLVFEIFGMSPIIVSNKTVKAFFGTKKKEKLFIVIADLLGWDTSECTYKKYNDMADACAQAMYVCDVLLEIKCIREIKDYGYKFRL